MDLCRTFQYIQPSDLFQTSVDTLPSAFHITVYFTFTILGTTTLTIYKALGTCRDRTDPARQVQLALTALVTFVLQRCHALETRYRVCITGCTDHLVIQIFRNGLYTHTAGEY